MVPKSRNKSKGDVKSGPGDPCFDPFLSPMEDKNQNCSPIMLPLEEFYPNDWNMLCLENPIPKQNPMQRTLKIFSQDGCFMTILWPIQFVVCDGISQLLEATKPRHGASLMGVMKDARTVLRESLALVSVRVSTPCESLGLETDVHRSGQSCELHKILRDVAICLMGWDVWFRVTLYFSCMTCVFY